MIRLLESISSGRVFAKVHDRVLAAVAAMVFDDEAAAYAEEQGLIIIGQAGDDAALLELPRVRTPGTVSTSFSAARKDRPTVGM
jgi:hypothetical protein